MNESFAQGTVLLVEDNDANRRLIRAVLGRRHRIVEAADLDEARRLLAEMTPSLVLLDIRLRGEDGLDLAREIRGTPRLKDVPVIAVTAHALKNDTARILEAGCDACVSKPIDTRDLPRLVQRYIMQGRRAGYGT